MEDEAAAGEKGRANVEVPLKKTVTAAFVLDTYHIQVV